MIFSKLGRALIVFALLSMFTWIDKAFADTADNFLPVDEAFQLSTNVGADRVEFNWKIAEGYYLYQERFKVVSGDAALPFDLNEGKIKYDPYFEKDMLVYEGNANLTLLTEGVNEPFNVRIVSQGCAYAGLCYPIRNQFFTVDPQARTITSITAAESAASNLVYKRLQTNQPAEPARPMSEWLFEAILFAILGGMILNLMPCVFPVLSIKVIGLAQADKEHLAAHGWVYTLGIISCFLGFALILLLARAGGEAIGWGFQLQSPYIITALAYLFFVMGLSLSGMINIGVSWMGAGQSLTQRSGLSGSFFTGVLAAVVASPCTAPFMGVALGYALTQPGVVSVFIFASLGFGMALPMLLLCYMPSLVDKMPRPGMWMETLKEVLAFPLYLTSVWLLWVLGRQEGVNTLIAVCAGAVLITFGLWLFNRSTESLLGKWVRRASIFTAWGVALFLPWQLLAGSDKDDLWQPYSPSAFEEARASGKPVFVNLTADWCITCLANEKVALGTDDVEAAMEEMGVIALKGDWTNEDPEITKLLNQYGRSGVPMYLWIPAGHTDDAIVLPQILNKTIVLNALQGSHEQLVSAK